jgi:hypothetical protein
MLKSSTTAIGMGLDMFMRLKTGIRAIGKEKVG